MKSKHTKRRYIDDAIIDIIEQNKKKRDEYLIHKYENNEMMSKLLVKGQGRNEEQLVELGSIYRV